MTTMTTVKKKSVTEILAVREKELLEVNYTLEEFAGHVEVNYDDRWTRHRWRVNGDEDLYFWIYDHWQNREEDMASDALVIESAYKYFRKYQARKGQVNSHSVYVKDTEEIFVVPNKGLEYASVRLAKDNVDGLFRYTTSYYFGLGGGSSAPSFSSKITKIRNDAILQGARELLETITRSSQSSDDPGRFNPFLNKIRMFIENLEDSIIQPSLFS